MSSSCKIIFLATTCSTHNFNGSNMCTNLKVTSKRQSLAEVNILEIVIKEKVSRYDECFHRSPYMIQKNTDNNHTTEILEELFQNKTLTI